MLFPLAEAFSGPLYQSVFLIANNINELWFTEVEEEFTGMITESCRMDKKPQESGLGNRKIMIQRERSKLGRTSLEEEIIHSFIQQLLNVGYTMPVTVLGREKTKVTKQSLSP